MADRQQHARAVALLEKIKNAVISMGWEVREVDQKDKNPCVFFGARKEDAEYPAIAAIDPENTTVIFLLDLRIDYPGEHARELAVAMQLINETLPLGNFDTFIAYEKVCYRLASICLDLELSEAYLKEMLLWSAEIAATYEPLLAAIQSGNMAIWNAVWLFDAMKVQPKCPPEQLDKKMGAVYQGLWEELEKKGFELGCDENHRLAFVETKEDGDPLLRLVVCELLDAVTVLWRLPFDVNHCRRVDMAAAVTYLSSQTNDGYFIYEIPNEALVFRGNCFFEDKESAGRAFCKMVERIRHYQKTCLEPLTKLNAGEITLREFRNQV